MIELSIDGVRTRVEEGATVLDAARTMGIVIPTLCHYPGLSNYGECRVCMVEVKGKKSSLEASCTMPVEPGLEIVTNSPRVRKARKMVVELLLSACPKSKKLQDLAASMGVNQVRFKIKEKNCILCGRCVRYCEEEMQSGGIGFVGRGTGRKVGTAFGKMPKECRHCGGCEWVCPVCEQACNANSLVNGICGGCLNLAVVESCPVCVKCSEAVGPRGHKTY
jgi:NADH dehydrogenase/NADH:ubiquinone oxidoreductase subunit G